MDVKGLLRAATLEAATAKLTGGTPGIGKVLTSDADGLGSWATPAGGGGNWSLVSNLTGSFGASGPNFTSLALSTARAYLLTWNATLLSGSSAPAYFVGNPNGAAPSSPHTLQFNNGTSIVVDAAATGSPRIARQDFGADIMEVNGSLMIWLPRNSGFPHWSCEMSTYNNSTVTNMQHSFGGGRFNLGASIDLTSMQVITDGTFNMGAGSQWSLYKAQ